MSEPYAVYMFGSPAAPAHAEAIRRKQGDLAASLPISGRKPISCLSPSESLEDALPAASLWRLRRLENEHGPRGIIHGNFPLPE